MNKNQWILPFLFMCMIVLFAFVRKQDISGTIKGTVKPYNGALHVYAVSDKDTVHSEVTSGGQFELKKLKGGRYRVIAEGQRPYKVTTKPDVNVNPGSVVDIGEIVLDQ